MPVGVRAAETMYTGGRDDMVGISVVDKLIERQGNRNTDLQFKERKDEQKMHVFFLWESCQPDDRHVPAAS